MAPGHDSPPLASGAAGTGGKLRVKGLLVLVGSSIAGALGWWLGDLVGTWTAFVTSTVFTGAGAYLTRRLSQDYLP